MSPPAHPPADVGAQLPPTNAGAHHPPAHAGAQGPPANAGASLPEGGGTELGLDGKPLLESLTELGLGPDGKLLDQSEGARTSPARTLSEPPAKQRSRSLKLRETSAPPGPESKKPRHDSVAAALMSDGPEHFAGLADDCQAQLRIKADDKPVAAPIKAADA